MRKRPEVPKHLQKKVAKQLLERQKRAGVYEKGLADVAKHVAAGSFFPVDALEGVTQGAFTPSASYKAAMMRPPVPSDYKFDPETGKPVFKGKPPVVNPEFKGTTEHIGKKLGIDIGDPGGLAPQMLSPDPLARIKALGILGKLGWENLAGLGAVYGGLKKVEKADDVAKPIVKATDDVSLNNPLSPPKDAAEKLNRKLQRTKTTKARKKKNKNYIPPGSHKNKSIILKPKKDVDLPPIEIGGQKTKNWVIKIEGVLSPEEIVEAAGWYREGKMVQPLIESAGPGLTPELQAGFMLGAVQKSPHGALLSYLKQREQVKRGVAFEDRMKSGTSDLPLYQLAGGEEITGGAGQKIYDFVDAGVKNPTRTFYGNDIKAGQPFTMDRHTTRDMGYLDETFLNFLTENYKVPKDLKVDFEGAPAETIYEFGGDIGRKLTDELNAQGFGEKYGIGELSASDTQAIGWAAMLKLYNQPFDDLAGAISTNIQRVSAELKFGEGSPLAAKFGEQYKSLDIDQQYQVTREAMNWVANRASEISGSLSVGRVHGSGGWENFPPTPAVVENLLASPGGADVYADIVGYLANQTEVWAVREVSKNAQDANGILLDIIESGSKNIEDGDNLQAIWRKLNEYNPEVFQGYQPLSYEGKSGIRVIVPFKYNPFKNKPALRKYVEDNREELIKAVEEVFPGDNKFDINLADANIRFHNNDWTESKNGESYLERLERSTNGEITRGLRVSDRAEFEAFLQGLFDSTKRTTGTDTGIPKTEVSLRGVTPPQSTVSPNNSPPTFRTDAQKHQSKTDAQRILAQ